ncbi:hypothetical protein MTR67_009302 [Solanum verrucosum]|uniref:Uncharacterized protein n=1 Tax=Solanum verrucosum TaxID=315347 RepID=A0AAF0Q3Y5_SOLVR|nr:hypothetical protein MTR67_009302 [Solanum verrucosum]
MPLLLLCDCVGRNGTWSSECSFSILPLYH